MDQREMPQESESGAVAALGERGDGQGISEPEGNVSSTQVLMSLTMEIGETKGRSSSVKTTEDSQELDASLPTSLRPSEEVNLETMEGLAKALALDVESVFDFTAELERLLNPDSNEDEHDRAVVEEAAALKQQNAAILDKMSKLMRSVSTKKSDDGEEKKKAREDT